MKGRYHYSHWKERSQTVKILSGSGVLWSFTGAAWEWSPDPWLTFFLNFKKSFFKAVNRFCLGLQVTTDGLPKKPLICDFMNSYGFQKIYIPNQGHETPRINGWALNKLILTCKLTSLKDNAKNLTAHKQHKLVCMYLHISEHTEKINFWPHKDEDKLLTPGEPWVFSFRVQPSWVTFHPAGAISSYPPPLHNHLQSTGLSQRENWTKLLKIKWK